MSHDCWCGQLAHRHNLVGFKNHKKNGLAPRTQILTKTFFCTLEYPCLNGKNNLACSGLVLGSILTSEVKVKQYKENPNFDQIYQNI